MNAQANRRSDRRARRKKAADPAGDRRSSREAADLTGPPKSGAGPKGSPKQLELAMAERRAHLAATIDELAARAQPKEIARRTSLGLREKVQGLTHTPDGDLRTERLAAVGGAALVLVAVMAVLRRRR